MDFPYYLLTMPSKAVYNENLVFVKGGAIAIDEKTKEYEIFVSIYEFEGSYYTGHSYGIGTAGRGTPAMKDFGENFDTFEGALQSAILDAKEWFTSQNIGQFVAQAEHKKCEKALKFLNSYNYATYSAKRLE